MDEKNKMNGGVTADFIAHDESPMKRSLTLDILMLIKMAMSLIQMFILSVRW